MKVYGQDPAVQVRDMLDRDAGAQERVLGGVGQQAEQEFRNLVGKLTDTSVQIQDINVGFVIKFKWWSI